MVARQRIIGKIGQVPLDVVINRPDHVGVQTVIVDEDLEEDRKLHQNGRKSKNGARVCIYEE